MANIIEFEDKVDLIDSPEVPDNQKLKASEINKIRDLINEAYYRVRNLEINGAVGGDTVPIGTIMNYAGDGMQNGWLICDGREISRTEFTDLFAVIGTKYGAGDGTSTFNLPQGLEPIFYGADDASSGTLKRYDPQLKIIIKAKQIVPITSEVITDESKASDYNSLASTTVLQKFKDAKNESENGYIKMPDGTLMCWGQYNSNGEEYLINFPVPFIDIYYGFSTVPIYYHLDYHAILHSMNTGYCKLSFKDFGSNDTVGNIVGRWMAIGRWK